MSSTPAMDAGLIGDDAHRAALQTSETDNDVGRKLRLYLQKVLMIHNAQQQCTNVIGDLRVNRNHIVHVGVGLDARGEGHAAADLQDCLRAKS